MIWQKFRDAMGWKPIDYHKDDFPHDLYKEKSSGGEPEFQDSFQPYSVNEPLENEQSDSPPHHYPQHPHHSKHPRHSPGIHIFFGDGVHGHRRAMEEIDEAVGSIDESISSMGKAFEMMEQQMHEMFQMGPTFKFSIGSGGKDLVDIGVSIPDSTQEKSPRDQMLKPSPDEPSPRDQMLKSPDEPTMWGEVLENPPDNSLLKSQDNAEQDWVENKGALLSPRGYNFMDRPRGSYFGGFMDSMFGAFSNMEDSDTNIKIFSNENPSNVFHNYTKQSISIRCRPDGTVEETRTYKDSTGKEETTTTIHDGPIIRMG